MKRHNRIRYTILLTAALLAQSAVHAEDGPLLQVKEDSDFGSTGLVLTGVILFGLLILVPVMSRLGSMLDGEEAGARFSWKAWWSQLNNSTLTRAIPLEQEADHLLDHDYDGIRELDNALPPWWKWGFVLTVFVAVGYIGYFQFGPGLNPEQEYNSEMKVAAADIEAYRKAANDNVDEKTVTMADAAGIAKGKAIFAKNCFVCHGAAGEGMVGPNLTDDYWLHGGSIHDVFKTIKYGYPDKGMQSWEKMLSPGEIRNIASYVKSLRGTKPANPKAPQGEEYTEEAAPIAKDSTSMAKS